MPKENETGSDDPQGKPGLDNPTGKIGSDGSSSADGITLDEAISQLAEARAAIGRINEEAKLNREGREAAEAETERLRQEQLAEQGEYKTLYEKEKVKSTSLAAKSEQADRLEAAVIASNEKRIAQIPDHMRDDFNHLATLLTPEDLSASLDRFVPKLTAATPPNLDGGMGGLTGARKHALKVTVEDRSQANVAGDYGFPVDAEKLAARREQLEDNQNE